MPLAEIGTLIGALAAVAAVLALAWIATHCLAMRLPTARFSAAGAGRLRLLERLPLGREEYLAVVRAGETVLLLGVSAGQITLLKELNAGEAAEWTAEQTGAQPMPFRDALRQVLQKNQKQEGTKP